MSDTGEPARKKRSGRRFSALVMAQLESLIQRTANTLSESDDYPTGETVTNPQIVQAALPEAKVILAKKFDVMVASILSSLVAPTLSREADKPESSPLLAPLRLGAMSTWLAIPAEAGGPEYWKKLGAGHPTPAELDRVIHKREEDISGRRTEVEKIRIVRDTARARGCGDNDPIETVLKDDPPSHPTSPDDRPRP